MYPDRELIRLGVHKAALRRRIARSRVQNAAAVARLAQPFAWLERAVAFVRRITANSSSAVVPVGLLVVSARFPRLKILNTLLQWGPFAYRAAQRIGAAVTSRQSS